MAIVVDEFGEDHEASQVCVKMCKSLWVRVWLDLKSKEYTTEEIKETAGTVYLAAIRRANDLPIWPPSIIELETIDTTFLEIEYD